jgi:hypothetical protein
MTLARPTSRLVLIGLAIMLVAAGLALWYERLRADGAIRLWPLVLVIVGTAKAGSGPLEQQEEGLWLIGAGLWLLVETLVPVVMQGLAPLAIVVSGLAALRWAWPWHATPGAASQPLSAGENAHVN